MERLGDLVKKYIDLRDEIAREDLDSVANEYVLLEELVSDLERENKYVAQRLNGKYENKAEKTVDIFEHARNEQDIKDNTKAIEEIDDRVSNLENELKAAVNDMTDLGDMEVNINEQLHGLNVVALQANTNGELSGNKKSLNVIRRDLAFLQKMKSGQQGTINKIEVKLAELNKEKEERTVTINIAKTKLSHIEGRQNNPNGYDDLKARKTDEDLLKQNNTLIEQSHAKMAELARDKEKEAKEVLENLNNYKAQSATPDENSKNEGEPAKKPGIRDIEVAPSNRKVKGIRKVLQGVGEFITSQAPRVKNYLSNLYNKYDIKNWFLPLTARGEMDEPTNSERDQGSVRRL